MRRELGRSISGLALVLTLEAIVLGCMTSPADLFGSGAPLRNGDHTLHFTEALGFRERSAEGGGLLGWDPRWMAGYPTGVIGAVDNKLFAAVVALAPEGLEGPVFNLAVLGAVLAPTAASWSAALALGASAGAVTATAALAAAATFALPVLAFFWVGGAVSFVLGVGFAVAAVPLVVGDSTRSIVAGVVLATLAVGTHAGALPVVAFALAGAWVLGPRQGFVRRGVGLGVRAIPALLCLAPVVLAGLAFGDQLENPRIGGFLQGGATRFAVDWLHGWFRTEPGWNGGSGVLPAIVLFAVFGVRASDLREPRRAALLLTAVACGVLAYGVSWIGPARAIQPYRYLIPFALLASVPAGVGLVRVLGDARRGRVRALAVLGVGLLVVVEASTSLLPRFALGTGDDPAVAPLVAFLEREAAPTERVAVESPFANVAAWPGSDREIHVQRFQDLSLRLDHELVGYGGLGILNRHRYARFSGGSLVGHRLRELDEPGLESLLRRYALGWVVAVVPETIAVLDERAGVLERRAAFEGVVVYRLRGPAPSRVLEGEATVVAGPDQIEVSAARGATIVIAYHWVPTFRVEPPVVIEEAPREGAPVGFVRVRPNGRESFTIRHERAWWRW